MELVPWDPLRDMVSLREAMDRLFDRSVINPQLYKAEGGVGYSPAIDMYETDKEVVVKALVPGIKTEELSIDITEEALTIKGETKTETEEKKENYYFKELRQGSFTRSIMLPANLKADKAEAVLEDGMLTLTIPKAEEKKPQSIKIKAKQVGEPKKEIKQPTK